MVKTRNRNSIMLSETEIWKTKLHKEWDYEKNNKNNIHPDTTTSKSNKRAAWKCPKCTGPYEATIDNKTNGRGCPFCSGRQVLKGFNDLATTHPQIAALFDRKSPINIEQGITPENVNAGSMKMAAWKCPKCKGEHEATINNKTTGRGCPFCSGRQVLKGFNDLATTHPQVAKLFDKKSPINIEQKITLENVTAGSNKIAAWLCPKCKGKHKARIIEKTRGMDCPFCSGRQVLKGFNDLATTHPQIATLLDRNHPENIEQNITPEEVTAGSGKIAVWKCPKCTKKHKAIICDKTRGKGCPFCAGSYEGAGAHKLLNFILLVLDYKFTGGLTDDVLFLALEKIKTIDRGETKSVINLAKHGSVQELKRKASELTSTIKPGALLEEELNILKKHGIKVQDFNEDNHNASKNGRKRGGASEDILNDVISMPDDFKPVKKNQNTDYFSSVSHKIDSMKSLEASAKLHENKLTAGNYDEVVSQFTALTTVNLWQETFTEMSTFSFQKQGDKKSFQQLDIVKRTRRRLRELEREDSECFTRLVLESFLEDFDAAVELEVPSAWRFSANNDGCVTKPSLMQRLVAMRINRDGFLGNYSGTGAGKSAAAILSAQYANAGIKRGHVCVVVCPNNVVDSMKSAILNAYGDKSNRGGEQTVSIVTKTLDDLDKKFSTKRGIPNWLIINVDMLHDHNVNNMISFVNNYTVDFIMMDEVHYVKQRGSRDYDEDITSFDGVEKKNLKKDSRRSALARVFMKEISDKNPSILRMVSSATPIKNDLSEGVSAEELLTLQQSYCANNTQATVSNAIKLRSCLMHDGVRFVPDYSKTINVTQELPRVRIKANSKEEKTILALAKKHTQTSVLSAFKNATSYHDMDNLCSLAMIPDLVKTIKTHKKQNKGIIVYLDKTKTVLQDITSELDKQGITYALYNGSTTDMERNNIKNQCVNAREEKPDFDVILASSAISTGVDGLQYWAETLYILTLPWTHADYAQLTGRIIRQGSPFKNINIIIPQVILSLNNKNNDWSWNAYRWSIIQKKKVLGDCVMDGVIPEATSINPRKAYQQAIKMLNQEEKILSYSTKTSINDSLPKNTNTTKQQKTRTQSKTIITTSFTKKHNTYKRSNSTTIHEKFKNNPSEWIEYHDEYEKAREEWGFIPIVDAINKLIQTKKTKKKTKPELIDLGCGTGLLKQHFNHAFNITEVDHQAYHDNVIQANITTWANANTYEQDHGVLHNFAVLSLTMWSKDSDKLLDAAWNTLDYNQQLIIVEPTKHLTKNKTITTQDEKRIRTSLAQHGFELQKLLLSNNNQFTYILALAIEPEETTSKKEKFII